MSERTLPLGGATLLVLLLAAGCTLFDQAPAEPEVTDDRAIARAVMSRLSVDDITRSQGFGVRVERGIVTLYGSVPSEAARARALSIVRGTPGVIEVEDELRVHADLVQPSGPTIPAY